MPIGGAQSKQASKQPDVSLNEVSRNCKRYGPEQDVTPYCEPKLFELGPTEAQFDTEMRQSWNGKDKRWTTTAEANLMVSLMS